MADWYRSMADGGSSGGELLLGGVFLLWEG